MRLQYFLLILSCQIFNHIVMQKVVNFGFRCKGVDSYDFNIDHITQRIETEGWKIKQISTTSFMHRIINVDYPVISVTLLLEK